MKLIGLMLLLGQTPATDAAPSGQVPATPVATPAASPPQPGVPSETELVSLGKELRCPVCQGMSIAESPSDMAQSMMRRVRELSAEGKDAEQIKAYFVERYGEWVLLSPPTHGFNALVWVLPPAALGLGFLVVLRRLAQKRPPRPATAPPASPSNDPYVAAVRQKLESEDF